MTKEKQIESSLLISIVLLLSSLVFLIILIVSIGDYNKSKTSLSLKEYNDTYRQNSLFGIAVMPLGFIGFIAFSIKYLIIYLKTNKK